MKISKRHAKIARPLLPVSMRDMLHFRVLAETRRPGLEKKECWQCAICWCPNLYQYTLFEGQRPPPFEGGLCRRASRNPSTSAGKYCGHGSRKKPFGPGNGGTTQLRGETNCVNNRRDACKRTERIPEFCRYKIAEATKATEGGVFGCPDGTSAASKRP